MRKKLPDRIDYGVACQCGHQAVNHEAESINRMRMRRINCLLCECKRYKPIDEATDDEASTSGRTR